MTNKYIELVRVVTRVIESSDSADDYSPEKTAKKILDKLTRADVLVGVALGALRADVTVGEYIEMLVNQDLLPESSEQTELDLK